MRAKQHTCACARIGLALKCRARLFALAEVIQACRHDHRVREALQLPERIRQEDGSRDKFEQLFQKVDVDDSHTIDVDEFIVFWKTHIVPFLAEQALLDLELDDAEPPTDSHSEAVHPEASAPPPARAQAPTVPTSRPQAASAKPPARTSSSPRPQPTASAQTSARTSCSSLPQAQASPPIRRMEKRVSSSAIHLRCAEAFQLIDKNGDGKLSRIGNDRQRAVAVRLELCGMDR